MATEVFKAIDGIHFKIVMNGNDITDGIAEAEVTKTVSRQTNNSLNGNIVSVSEGKKSYSGSITLKNWLVDDIMNSLPTGKDLTDSEPFSLTIGYFQENGRKRSKTVVALFNNDAIAVKGADDMDTMTKYELTILSYKNN